MSEPYWVPIGASGVIPQGALVTALPGSPVDGQEVVLTDSLTVPTYAWHLRYVAAKASNKWIHLGGSARFSEVVTPEAVAGAAYGNPVGPDMTVPVTGDYWITIGCRVSSTDATVILAGMSYAIGAAAALDADAILWGKDNSANPQYGGMTRRRQKSLVGGAALTMRYKKSAGALSVADRWLALEPLAIGG
jgi:hypothetical protein